MVFTTSIFMKRAMTRCHCVEIYVEFIPESLKSTGSKGRN